MLGHFRTKNRLNYFSKKQMAIHTRVLLRILSSMETSFLDGREQYRKLLLERDTLRN